LELLSLEGGIDHAAPENESETPPDRFWEISIVLVSNFKLFDQTVLSDEPRPM
jgi:hypothetical protein